MTDNDQAFALSLDKGDDPSGRFWAGDSLPDLKDEPADLNTGLTDLGFIRAAIRRSARLLSAVAVAGLLIGSAVYLASPHAAQASTTLLLTIGPEAAPGSGIVDDATIAQSRGVAELVVRKLRLPQSVSSFQSSYTATPLTERVLLITATAPSSDEAVIWANTVAAEFLRFRAQQLDAAQQKVFVALNQQIDQAGQQVSRINSQISKLLAQPRSPSQQAALTTLRTQLKQANKTLVTLQQSVNNTRATTQETTASQIKGSGVLDAAAPLPPHSKLKHLILYGAIGFFGGLVVTLAIVVIRALLSDRLRRRDDIARALGAPVRLSVGNIPLGRWRPGRRHGLAAAGDTGIRQIAAHLGRAVPTRSRRHAALAVVPVDNPKVAALSLMALAISCAQQGMRVVVADLGGVAADLLGSREPGIRPVNVQDAHFIVAVPGPEDVAPVGPLGLTSRHGQRSSFTEGVTAECASSDVLLTLAPLDPSVGGEHLASWATDAVVIITAGRSSWTKIHAVGEMIRLAGTRLISAVLVSAEKTDESLGVVPASGAGPDAQAVKESPHSEGEDLSLIADRGTGGRRS